MGEEFEDKIRKSLSMGTEQSAKLKEQVWENIRTHIESCEGRGDKMTVKRKNGFLKIISSTMVAAAMLSIFFVATEPGQAAIGKIKDFFAPEKKIVQELEGTEEETDVALQESEMGYIIYLDQERYTIVKGDGVDKIIPKITGDNIPEVYMEIKQIKDKSPETLASEIEEELKANFSKVQNLGKVSEPLEGIQIHALDKEPKWDSIVVDYFLVDNTKGGSFIIKQHYFLEAAEGHGVRFDNMLKEFVVVSVDE